MNKENKLVPELRFPEFVNKGEWVVKKLDEIANIVASGDLDIDSFSSEPTGIHIYPIYSNSISKEGLYGYNTYSKYKPNSVTITARGTLGIAFVRNTEFVGIGRLLVVSDLNNVDPIFLKENWNHYANVPLENGGIPQLTAIKAKLVTLLYPKFPEQQKIASCLSSLDELINAHSQKLDALKDYKKGLMQQLFPAEGETVPKLRFKEFENNGEWVEATFGSAATFINGKAYKQEELLDKGKYKVLRVGNFFTNNNWYYSDLELETDKYCDNGDLLYAWSASFGPRIWEGDKTIYHYHIWKVVENPEIDKSFLFKLLDNETEKMKSQNANGFALLHITKGTIENWKCNFPRNKKEQQKIATSLFSIDKLITAQSHKIEALKEHKKGLMQGLFPIINQ
jgi:type I restriction enzyme S subunit